MVTNHILNLRFSSGESPRTPRDAPWPAQVRTDGTSALPSHDTKSQETLPGLDITWWVGKSPPNKKVFFFFFTGHQYFIYYRNRNRNICIYIYILIIIDDLPVMMRFHEVPAFFLFWVASLDLPPAGHMSGCDCRDCGQKAQRAEMALCEKRGWKKSMYSCSVAHWFWSGWIVSWTCNLTTPSVIGAISKIDVASWFHGPSY